MNLGAAFGVMSMVFAFWLPTPADPPCRDIVCEIGGGGSYVGMSKAETRHLRDTFPPGTSPEAPEKWYEYSAVIDCAGNDPYYPDRVHCEFATAYCEEHRPDSHGPYSRIYRRVVDDSGPTSGYALVGPTCFRSVVPERSGEPPQELTEEMILEQFHQTQFALPSASVEPPGGRVLVNLPVYFELTWPEDGFEPEEIDTSEIIGHEVRIRPTLDSVTYFFGDGESIGPTESLGGSYPDGDVTHEYTDATAVEPYISVVYGGEVSVDGGAWSTIPGSVTVDGPATPLDVLTSTNRLYD